MADQVYSWDPNTDELTPANPPQQHAPPAAPPQLPPGSTPGGLQLNPDAPPTQFLPLSQRAKNIEDTQFMAGMMGNRAMVTGLNAQYAKEPSVAAGPELGKKWADAAIQRSLLQDSGTRMLTAVQALRDRVYATPESTWQNSFGPDNTKVMPVKTTVGFLHPYAWSMPDMAPVEARYIFDKNNPKNIEAMNTWNNWKHLVDATTEGLLGTGNKQAAGSDARMQIFQDMIDRTTNATNRSDAMRILHDAEDRIRSNSALPPRPGAVNNPIGIASRADLTKVGVGDYFQLGDGTTLQKPYIMPPEKIPTRTQINALHAHPETAGDFMRWFGISPETLRAKYLPNYQPATPTLPPTQSAAQQ